MSLARPRGEGEAGSAQLDGEKHPEQLRRARLQSRSEARDGLTKGDRRPQLDDQGAQGAGSTHDADVEHVRAKREGAPGLVVDGSGFAAQPKGGGERGEIVERPSAGNSLGGRAECVHVARLAACRTRTAIIRVPAGSQLSPSLQPIAATVRL